MGEPQIAQPHAPSQDHVSPLLKYVSTFYVCDRPPPPCMAHGDRSEDLFISVSTALGIQNEVSLRVCGICPPVLLTSHVSLSHLFLHF